VVAALIRRFHEAKESGAASVMIWGTGTPLKRVDVTRMANLGWRAKTKLEDGLKHAYDAFLKEVKSGHLRAK